MEHGWHDFGLVGAKQTDLENNFKVELDKVDIGYRECMKLSSIPKLTERI